MLSDQWTFLEHNLLLIIVVLIFIVMLFVIVAGTGT